VSPRPWTAPPGQTSPDSTNPEHHRLFTSRHSFFLKVQLEH
jgi:hypothetical protein